MDENKIESENKVTETDTQKGRKKRRFPIWARVVSIILASVLLLSLAAVGTAYIFINSQLSKIERPDIDPVETVPPKDEIFEEDEYQEGTQIVAPEDIIWDDDINTLHSDSVINILLVGQDTRTEGTTGRTDSIMILTIDTKTKKLKVTSLMRDMYVQIPGYSDNRINTAYFFGGYELLQATIEKNFGVRIDYFAEIDFFAFVRIVDMLDGIYINLNAEEAAMLKNWGHRTVEGRNRLDGDAALSYCTMRQIGNSDYERTERQRKAMASIYARLKETVSVPFILELVDEIFPQITTNMTNGQIMSLAMTVYTMNAEGIEQYRLPADGTFTPMYIRGMAVLVPDLSACRKYLQEILYSD